MVLADAGEIPNPDSQSAGDTRLFRMAYFEAPDYVPLLKRAREEWLEWGALAGEELFMPVGVLMVGASDSDLIVGARRSLEAFPTRAEILEQVALERRFPHLTFRQGEVGVMDLEGGFVFAGRALRAVLAEAVRLGVRLRPRTFVRSVEESRDGVRVVGSAELFADRAILCAGLGFREMVVLGRRTRVWGARQVLTYWPLEATVRPEVWEGHPAFAFMEGAMLTYGVPPNRASVGVKVARHVQAVGGTHAPSEDDFAPVRDFVSERFGFTEDSSPSATVCHYDMTSEGDLCLGFVPGSERVSVIGSMSGHGFKLGPAVAEAVVAEMFDGFGGLIPERLRSGRLFED